MDIHAWVTSLYSVADAVHRSTNLLLDIMDSAGTLISAFFIRLFDVIGLFYVYQIINAHHREPVSSLDDRAAKSSGGQSAPRAPKKPRRSRKRRASLGRRRTNKTR